jgi:hypothetical protein
VTEGRAVAVTVDYAVPSGSYGVEVRTPAGASRIIGAMAVTGGHGSWTGTSDVVLVAGSTIGLVDGSGNPVCRGAVAS